MELEIGKVFNDLLLFDKISERTFQRRGVNTRSVISSRERERERWRLFFWKLFGTEMNFIILQGIGIRI